MTNVEYTRGVEIAAQLCALLGQGRLNLATAESCTGGLLAALITEVPDVSAIYRGGVCTYSVDAKIEVLGVDAQLIADYGVVSGEVALAMATRVRAMFHADIGIATTGIAGPSGATAELPVGSVYWGVDYTGPDGRRLHEARLLRMSGNRREIRFGAATQILHMLQRML